MKTTKETHKELIARTFREEMAKMAFEELTPEQLDERPLPILPDTLHLRAEARRRRIQENPSGPSQIL